MTVYVDADACPVVRIVENVSKKYHIPVVLLCDTNHVLYSDYSAVKTIGAGADAVDFALVNLCRKGDIVVTQDYGVAAMALGRGAYCIHQSGRWYTEKNIDTLLAERYVSKKARMASGKNHLKGSRKRTDEDNKRFEESFEKLIGKVIRMNETVNVLLNRASPRSFKNEHVEKEKLDAIVNAALKAPSGMNRQTPVFIVVTDDKTVEKLSKLNAEVMGADTDPFYGAKDVICVLTRKEGTYIYDGSLAIGNILNAAFSLGVDSRWIHRCKEVFNGEEGKKILADLGIDYEVEGIGFCVLGYSEEKPEPKAIVPDRVFYI